MNDHRASSSPAPRAKGQKSLVAAPCLFGAYRVKHNVVTAKSKSRIYIFGADSILFLKKRVKIFVFSPPCLIFAIRY